MRKTLGLEAEGSCCACIGGSPKVPYANGETSHIKSDALAATGGPTTVGKTVGKTVGGP